MNEKTKITLSPKEQELVCDADWILTKCAIIEKVYQLFGDIALYMHQIAEGQKDTLPAGFFIAPPKISKGENYQSLPYVMLDYPRYFNKENAMAIRTFFWWGNFFSISLQLNGTFKTNAVAALVNNFTRLQQSGYWICINDTPWQHHFESDNYLYLKSSNEEEFAELLTREGFLKIAKKIPLNQWNNAKAFIEMSFTEMIRLLQIP
jgi:hypothetical protein